MEEKTTGGKGLQTENISEKKEYSRRWIFSDFAKKGVRYSLAFSFVIFILYTAGSMPDPGFPDRVLFFLLRVLRYSAIISCAFSLFALGFSVQRLVHHPSLRNILGLCFYFFTAMLGANLVLFGSFVVAATGGNV